MIIRSNHDPAAGNRQIDCREPVVHIDHLLVELKSQSRVNREVSSYTPVVLRVEMQPIRSAVFFSATEAYLRRGRVTQEKIGERVAVHGSDC